MLKSVVAVFIHGAASALGCVQTEGGSPSQGRSPSPAEAYEIDEAELRRGRLLFTGTCGGYCHPTKPGNRDAPYLFDCTWKHGGSDLEIFASIADGIPDSRMPAWQGKMPKGDSDIWRVIAYLRSKRSCGGSS